MKYIPHYFTPTLQIFKWMNLLSVHLFKFERVVVVIYHCILKVVRHFSSFWKDRNMPTFSGEATLSFSLPPFARLTEVLLRYQIRYPVRPHVFVKIDNEVFPTVTFPFWRNGLAWVYNACSGIFANNVYPNRIYHQSDADQEIPARG